MARFEDDEELRKAGYDVTARELRKASALGALSTQQDDTEGYTGGDDPAVAIAPVAPVPQAKTPNPVEQLIYNIKAKQLNDQADTLEKQTPTRAQTIMNDIATGMSGFSAGLRGQGTFTDYGAQQQADRLARVKQIRDEARQQQQLGLTEEQRQIENRRADIAEERANAAEQRAIAADARQKLIDDAQLEKLKLEGWHPVEDASGQYLVRPDGKGGAITIRTAGPKVDTKNLQSYDVHEPLPNGNVHTTRHYFATDPNSVVATADLGTQPAQGGGGLQMAQSTINGQPVIGGYDKKGNTFAPATLKGDKSGAPVLTADQGKLNEKDIDKAKTELQNAKTALAQMEEAYQDVKSGKSLAPGADDMVLLSGHLGMTFGGLKGARLNRDIIEEHKDAIPYGTRIERGIDGALTGAQLAPEQRDQFIALARNKVKNLQDALDRVSGEAGGQSSPSSNSTSEIGAPGSAVDQLLRKRGLR